MRCLGCAHAPFTMVLCETDLRQRALRIYKWVEKNDGVPLNRVLRTFVGNYQNVHSGKRAGNTFASVDAILVRCIPNFEKKCMPAKSSTARIQKRNKTLTYHRAKAWKRCYRLFGAWPSQARYRQHKIEWEADAILSTFQPTEVINSFKNYKQTVRGNGSGTRMYVHLNRQLVKIDNTLFLRSYQKHTTKSSSSGIVPSYIQQLPNLVPPLSV